tara:strand:+ start:1234 stop:1470 length:237 start_codon:yes stop_codon:yes gene_type:complete
MKQKPEPKQELTLDTLDDEQVYSKEQVEKFLSTIGNTQRYIIGATCDDFFFITKDGFKFQAREKQNTKEYYLIGYPKD